MTIRRINHTGRKRISHERARIAVADSLRGGLQFDAALDFDGLDLPPDARVYIEAYRQTSWMRFDFGTAAAIIIPGDRDLRAFSVADGVLFRVKVTSSATPLGLILAEADGIRPRLPEDEDESRRSLLPVVPDMDLGAEVYRLEFEDCPILHVNGAIVNWREAVKSPTFVSLALPSVLRMILFRILHIEKYGEVDDKGDWRCQWLEFCRSIPGVGPVPALDGDEQADEWIDTAVARFSSHLRVIELYREFWDQGETA